MKTGSTSIQAWLRNNAAALREAGVALPLGEVDTNLSPLVADLEPRGKKGDNPIANAITPESLRAALEALPAEAHTCVISAELMGQRMRRDAVQAFRALIAPFFDRYRVILYLRRQDELAVSRHSTTLRRGDRGKMFNHPIDYARVIDDWGEAFGRAAIRPRLFARGELKDGDVVADFVETAGLPMVAAPTPGQEFNPSLDVDAQTLLAALARRHRAEHGEHLAGLPGQARLVAYLDRHHAGRGRMPSRAQAEAFLAQVAESNERVRREWFPDHPALFGDDFSKYPAEPTADPPLERQLEVAHGALLHLLAGQEARRGRKGKGKGAEKRRRRDPVAVAEAEMA